MQITEKEFAIIKEISNNHQPDQRTLAKNTGISLGLTNLIIKRLINKGYVKAKQLNRRKIQYILTPEGFTEKARKSYNFTLKTINVLTSMKQKIQSVINEEYGRGRREFIICGDGEISSLVDLAFRELKNPEIKVCRESIDNEVSFKFPYYLFTEENGNPKGNAKDSINIIAVLSENLSEQEDKN